MTTFDLTREPWIPVETLDGRVESRSTRDVLRSAHELRGIDDPSPLVTATLTRHLLAVLHRAHEGPKTRAAWIAIASARRFDGRVVDAYLDRVAARMDLFHPTHPFAQTRGLSKRFAKYVAPIDELELARSEWGPGRSLFRHRPEGEPVEMDPARAARALLAHHAFATGGLIKKPGEPVAATASPLVRAGVVILRGKSLFETLVANLLQYDPTGDKPIAADGEPDAPSWEQDPPPEALLRTDEPKRRPHGYLDLLTWLSRRVELIHDDRRVTGFINAVWTGLDEQSPQDPMVMWRRDEKRGLLSVGINPARAFWRDADALFTAVRDAQSPFLRPRAIDLVSNEEAERVLGAEISFAVETHGISAEKSRVDAVRREGVCALAKSFDDPEAHVAVTECLRRAEARVASLRGALRAFAEHALDEGGRGPDPKAVTSLAESFGAEAAVWSALGEVFQESLWKIGREPRAAVLDFDRASYGVVREVFVAATEHGSVGARWQRAAALADKVFHQSQPRRLDAPAALATPESQP